MSKIIDCDICVIGAGAGGLSVAAGAAKMGARSVLIEKAEMGGDCLNVGCVPSKALLAAAHSAQAVRGSGRFGVNGHEPEVDMPKVGEHVRGVVAALAHHDSQERFEGLGVQVLRGAGRFLQPDLVAAAGQRVRAKRFVIATGSSLAVPPLPGLAEVDYLTNETIFDLAERPEHLIVIGGGPIGLELAQAQRRLGARVSVIEGFEILGKDDPEAAEVVRQALLSEGLTLFEGTKVVSVARDGNAIAVTVTETPDGPEKTIKGTHLLIAAGRKANVDGLGLDKAGIEYGPRGISVDARLRTSNKKIFAIGDVTGDYQFTHMAGYQAGIVIRNALFRLPAKVDTSAVPWVTYTDPELAQVGLTEQVARERFGDKVKLLSWSFQENDRARAEGRSEGFVKAMVDGRGRILGATIVGAHAGELLQSWSLAMSAGLKIGAMAKFIAPYPTRGEINKRVAGSYFTNALFSAKTKKLVRALQFLP